MTFEYIDDLIKYSSKINIGIYYKRAYWANFVFDKLVNHFEKMDCIKWCHLERNGYGYIELDSGTTYRFVQANDSARGHKFDKAYYEYGIDEESVNNIIIPSLKSSICEVFPDSDLARGADNDE